MRSIGRIDHPSLQITVFSNDDRFPVQFETGGLTQVYRFRRSEQLRHLGDIRALLDAPFLAAVEAQFRSMERERARLLAGLRPATGAEPDGDLPVIL